MKPIMTIFVTGIILLFSTQSFAQTATDVTCTGCVGTTDLAASAVSGQKLQNNAVTTAKIQNSAVTTAKISDGTITNDDILDGTITASKISDGPDSGLDADKLDGVDASQFLRSDQSNTITGDLAVSGSLTTGSLTTGNINLSGNITSDADICIGTCE